MEVIAGMKPGVDGKIFIAIEEGENVETYLDVLVEKINSKFLTSVNRKPSFIGQHNRWNSFVPKNRKTNLIGTLAH